MSPMSWPLIGRLATGGTLPAPRPPGEATGTRYVNTRVREPAARFLPWLLAESRVISRLADAGGDLTAHRTVHLEEA